MPKAVITMPWSIWEELNANHAEEIRDCGGTIREFMGKDGALHHVELTARESFADSIIAWCAEMEKRVE
jgi:hypothetical protein